MAPTKAKQFLESLRTPNGWKTTELDRPAGGGKEQLFISPDRSRNDINKSRNLKHLHEIIKNKAPGATFVKLPREAVITCNWQPVVKLAVSDAFTTPAWDIGAEAIGLNKAEVEDAFKTKLAVFRT